MVMLKSISRQLMLPAYDLLSDSLGKQPGGIEGQ